MIALAAWTAAFLAPRLTPARRRAALAVGAVLAVIIPLCAPPLARNLTGQGRLRREAQTAFVTGVPDAKSIGYISFNMIDSMAASQGLKARGKWMFEDRWSRSVGTGIDVGAVQNQVCAGTFLLRDTETVGEGFFRVGGLVDRKAASAAKLVVVVDSTNQMVGYGLVPRRVSDIIPVTGSGATRLDWQGHAWDTRRPPYTAYLASAKALRCRIDAQLTPKTPAGHDGNLTASSPRITK
jgi:hypothetical protein